MKIKIKNIVFIFIMSYITLNAAVITKEESQLWTNAGFKAYDIERWKEVDGMTLEKAKIWKDLGVSSFDAKTITGILASPDELKEWLNIGIKVKDVYAWKVNAQNVDEAKKWLALGLDYYEVRKWKEKDVTSADEVEIWTSMGVTYDYLWDWHVLGIKSAQEAKDWVKAGFNTFEKIRKWKKQGINPFEAKAIIEKEESEKLAKEEIWGKEGINDYYVIKAWEEAGITDPKTARKLLDVEVDDREYSSWLRIGINDIDTIIKWRKLNKTSENIHYLNWWADIYTPEEYSSWESLGVDLDNIKRIKEGGIKTPEQFKEWMYYFDKNNKNYGYNIKALKAAGIDEPSKLKKWREHEIYQNEIPYFIRAGLDDPSEAKKWIALINNLAIIERVIKSGFKTVKDYEPYKEMDYYNASILYSFNIKPDNLTKSMDKIEKKFSKIMRLSSGKSFFSTKEDFLNVYNSVKKDCDEINYTKVFLEEEISNNKGKCYVFMGSMNQRDDKKPFLGDKKQNGVVTIEQNYFTTIGGIKQFAFYVEDFKGNWQENGHKVGIIKGTGSTEFNVKGLGEIKIPSGKVIHIF